MIVGRRMTSNPITINPETTVPEAQQIMRREKIHRLPVIDKHHKLVGIVTHKDLLYASPSPATSLNVYEVGYLLSKLPVRDIMTKELFTTTEDTSIEEAARLMRDNNIGGLPVMRGDKLIGIITESDLFKLFIELFGARKKGIRATVLIPEEKGELVKITGAIHGCNGDIISIGSFLGEDPTNVLLTLKVGNISLEQMKNCIKPYVMKIIDIREA